MKKLTKVFLFLQLLLISQWLIAQPLPPINIRVCSYLNENRIYWNHNPNETPGYVSNYEIFRRGNTGSAASIGMVSGNATQFPDNTAGRTFKDEFYYTVRAIGTDTLVSPQSEEVKRFLPRVGLTDISMQTNTVTDRQFVNFDPYPGYFTDVYWRVRSAPCAGSSFGGYYYSNCQVVCDYQSLNLPPGGPYYLEVIIGRPDWWGSPVNSYWYSYSSSEAFYVNSQVPYEDNASSTYFNSSNSRTMTVPLDPAGVGLAALSNSGGDFWRIRTPVRVSPYTRYLYNQFSRLAKLNAPCRTTIAVPAGQLAAGRAAAEVRVADERGHEIPSIVVSESTSDSWVNSFDVHFITSQNYNDSATYWVYWGNPSASQNFYDFVASSNTTSQFSYSPWYSRKILRGTNETATITDAYRIIASPPAPADDIQTNVTIPFSFPFFDTSSNSIYVSSNGYLTFSPFSSGNNTWNDFTASNSYRFIAPFWCNLMVNDSVPGTSGVYGRRIDAGNPQDRYQLTWRANRFNSPTEVYIFQAALYRSGDIAFRYENLNAGGLSTVPSGSGDNPINIAPHHTAGISRNDGSQYFSITDDSGSPAVCPLTDGIGRNVIHFFQSCHAWTRNTAFSDPTNICAMTGATTVGHYDSRIFDGRSSAPVWTNVELDTSGTGLIDFYVRTSTTMNFPNWSATHLIASDLASGAHSFALTLPDQRYVQYRAVFKKANNADAPVLNRVKFSVGYITIENTTNAFNANYVSQGQTFPASMTFTNNFSNSLDAQIASLTFTNGTQSFNRTTPLPTSVVPGASATIGFNVTVATNSSYLNSSIYIDGYVEASDGFSTLKNSQAISRSYFLVRQKPELIINQVNTAFDKVNKGQGGIPVTVQFSNPSPYVPLVFGGASLTFSLGNYSWSPENVFAPADEGLFAQYYNNNTAYPPVFPPSPAAKRLDPQINFTAADWANGLSPFPPNIATNYYGVRWSGYLTPQFSETHTFSFNAMGGVRLWINGKRLIDSWIWSNSTRTASLALTAGTPVEIVAEYYKLTGNGKAILSWSSPSLPVEVIPQSRLKPAYRSVIHGGASLITTFTVAVLPDSVSGLAYIDATASGTNAWVADQVTEDFSAAINDSWVIQSPASLSIGIIDAPELVYRGQGNIPVEVEIINLGEADAIISSVPVYISLGSYSAIIPGETMPVTINGQTSRMIKVLVSIEETTATGTATLDADVIGTDGNIGTPLSYSGAANPDTWTILAEKILTYSDANYILPLTSFVLPDTGLNHVYVKAESLAPLKEYAIRWFDTGGNEIVAAKTVGFADANGNLFSELPYDSSFAFGLYTVKITNPVGSYSQAQTNFSIVTSSNLSGSLILPSKVSIGQNFPAYMSIANSGGAQASGMVPTNLISGGTGLASLLSGPTPGSVDLAGNSAATFSWNFTAANSGSFLLSGHSQGFEAGSNKPVSVPAGCYDLLFEETFEDYAASETIDAKNSGYGFSGSWSAVAGIQETIMVSNTMDYTSGMGQTLYGGLKAARISGDNDFALTRNLPSSIDLPELYVSILVRFNGVQANNKFLALWLEDPGSGSAPNIGIKMNREDGSGVEDFFVSTQTNHAYHTNLVPGQTYLIVGRVTKFAGTGTYDKYELWVNPADLTTPGPPDATATGAAPISAFSKIGFRTVNLAPGDSYDIAAFRIGKSFASVTTQPLVSNVCMIQSPAQVTINSLIATPSVVYYDQKRIEVLATLENHGEADARIDLADILQTPYFGTDRLASPSALPAVIPGNSIATFSFRVDVNSGAPVGVATMTGQIRFEDVNNPVPTLRSGGQYAWTIVNTRMICARDSGFTMIQYTFTPGQTVYARASGLPTGMDVRMRFYDTTTNDPPLPGDVGVGIQTLLNTGSNGMATHFHNIPADTSKINQWMIVVDDGSETTLGNILGIQYFEVVRPPQIAYSVLIGSSTCFVGDTFSLDFKVTNTSTWPTNIRHYLINYTYASLYPQINGSGYFTLETPYPARGWFYDLGPGQSHTFTYLFKARSESGAGTASSAVQLVNSLWCFYNPSDGLWTYSPAMISSNSIRILKASFKIIPDGFTVPTTPGLLGEYYKTVTAYSPPMPGGATAYSRTDSEVNFNWITNNPYPAELGSDLYAVRWTGFVNPDNTGNYTFYTRTDDGTRLWVNGTPITNRWSGGLAEVHGTIALNAGVPVPIVMEFYEGYGNSIAQLSWEGPATPKAIIASSNLFHELDYGISWDFGVVDPGSQSTLLKNTLFNTGNIDLEEIDILRPLLRKTLTEFIPGSNIQITPTLPLNAAVSGSTSIDASLVIPYHQPMGVYVATLTVYEDLRKTGSFETDYPHKLILAQVEVPEVAKAIPLNEINFGAVPAGTTSAIKKLEYYCIGNKNLTDLRFHSPLPEITINPGSVGPQNFDATGSTDIFIDVPPTQPSGVYTVYGSIYDDIPGGASEPFKITWEVGTFAIDVQPNLIDFGQGTPTELLPEEIANVENPGELPLRRVKAVSSTFQNVSQAYSLASENVNISSPALVNVLATEQSTATVYIPGGTASGTYIGTFTWFEDQNENLNLDSFEASDSNLASFSVLDFYRIYTIKQTEDFGGVQPDTTKTISVGMRNAGNMAVTRLGFIVNSLSDGFDTYDAANLILPDPVLNVIPGELRYFDLGAFVPTFQKHGIFTGTMSIYGDINESGTFEAGEPIHTFNLRIEIGDQEISITSPAAINTSGNAASSTPPISVTVKNIGSLLMTRVKTRIDDLVPTLPGTSIASTAVSFNPSRQIGSLVPNQSRTYSIIINVPYAQTSGIYTSKLWAWEDANDDDIIQNEEASSSIDVTFEVIVVKELTTSPAALNLGILARGDTATASFMLQNIGNSQLNDVRWHMNSLSGPGIIDSTNFSISPSPVGIMATPPAGLPTSEPSTFTLSVPNGAADGSYSGNMISYEDDFNPALDTYDSGQEPGCSMTVQLQIVTPLVTILPNPVDIPAGNPTGQTASTTFSISNGSLIDFRSLRYSMENLLNGANIIPSANVLLNPTSFNALAIGGSQTIEISAILNPTTLAPGTYSGLLNIWDDRNFNGTLDPWEAAANTVIRATVNTYHNLNIIPTSVDAGKIARNNTSSPIIIGFVNNGNVQISALAWTRSNLNQGSDFIDLNLLEFTFLQPEPILPGDLASAQLKIGPIPNTQPLGIYGDDVQALWTGAITSDTINLRCEIIPGGPQNLASGSIYQEIATLSFPAVPAAPLNYCFSAYVCPGTGSAEIGFLTTNESGIKTDYFGISIASTGAVVTIPTTAEGGIADVQIYPHPTILDDLKWYRIYVKFPYVYDPLTASNTYLLLQNTSHENHAAWFDGVQLEQLESRFDRPTSWNRHRQLYSPTQQNSIDGKERYFEW